MNIEMLNIELNTYKLKIDTLQNEKNLLENKYYDADNLIKQLKD